MSLLIRNVKVLGADRDLPDRADVYVNGANISAIGSFPNKSAREIVEGNGAYLSPGFIDIDTTSDHYLGIFKDPSQADFLKQGVTTLIGGHCGASLAPLIYGGLESMEEWGDIRSVNVDWHTTAEFLKALERRPLGVNFGTFAGHSTIRRAIAGDDHRELTANELAVMKGVLARSLAEGAFGLSAGLDHPGGSAAAYSELRSLAKQTAASGGVFSMHLRGTDGSVAAGAKEVFRLRRDSGVKILLPHFSPIVGFEKEYEHTLMLAAKEEVFFDVHPFGRTFRAFYRFLPAWAQKGGITRMAKSLDDEWFAKRILRELPGIAPGDLMIEEAPRNPRLIGQDLASYMQITEVDDPRQALLSLLRLTRLRGVASVRNVNKQVLKEALVHPRSMVASHASAPVDEVHTGTARSLRTRSTFTEFLRLALREKLLPIGEAIKKITAMPAAVGGIPGRGAVREGYFADLVLFGEEGVKMVVVNGRVAVREGEYTGALAGRPLHKDRS